ncbi:unnamed protein product [Rotaria socialis]|uniref:G domain-containing protein n=2 Tax=Rotaria socialis TaxID=392032 RepID=A0A818AP76_9BILA|nr:unnamed protein product [Rotaria socialis]
MNSNQNNKKNKFWLDCHFHDVEQTSIMKPDELQISSKDYAHLSSIDDNSLDRIQGSMFGLAIGDALGAHVEFRPRSFLVDSPVTDLKGGGTWGLQPGQFTDDTSMALCLANSLIACQDFVPYDQLVRYKWWYRNGYMSSTGQCFDIGAATRQSIEEFERRQRKFAQDHGIPLDHIDLLSDRNLLQAFDVLCSKDGVAGNGALMRLAPVPLFFFRVPELAVEYSGVSGRITHGDNEACDACRYYGALIVAALNGETRVQLTSENFYDDHQQWFSNKALVPEIMKIAKGSYKKPGGYEDGIRGKGYIVDALEAALWAFWSDEDSFDKGSLKAVNLGDDTDTTAAIYGQLAGAYYGYKNLQPKKWVDSIYAKDFILCVSSWITYEGKKWFEKQVKPGESQLINSFDSMSSTSISNISFFMLPTSNRSYNPSLTGNLSLSPLLRKAILPSGHIGTLYDGWRDQVLEKLSIRLKVSSNGSSPVIECMIKSGKKSENRNVLRLLDFDIDLQLSILSNLVSPSGIASAVNYPFLIDEYTRILYYSFAARYQALLDDKDIQQKIDTNSATHAITAIDKGIDVVVLFRLPADDSKIIDAHLEHICHSLMNDTKPTFDEAVLNRIVSTHAYSNIPHLARQTKIVNMCQEIFKIKNNTHDYSPCNYILHPRKMFDLEHNHKNVEFFPIESRIATKIEDYWFRLSSISRIWTAFRNDKISKCYENDLKEQFHDVQNKVSQLIKQYNDETTQGRDLIQNMRRSKQSQEIMNEYQLQIDLKDKDLKSRIEDLMHDLRALKEKQEFINDLKTRKFTYWNAANRGIKQGDTEDEIEKKLIEDITQQRILCSTDIINAIHWTQLQDIFTQMTDERNRNPKLNLIYVDFSYCLHELDTIKVFPTTNYCSPSNTRASLTPKKIESISVTPKNCKNQMINIVLIGKTGVGKSTLINTIANCLKHRTYSEIQSNTSAIKVLISFIFPLINEMGTRLVSLGNNDPNEDHNHSGQSKTMRCKSHIFDIANGQKLRIIDTPGFSNVSSGQGQDEITMQYILSFVVNLTHLNAVCVLIENHESEFIGYQQCLKQLVNFLGPTAHDNLIFCLTKCLSNNVHSNINTNPVQSLLNSVSLGNIPLNDENILRFDSTFFIHLAKTRFTGNQEPNCEMSWSISKNSLDKLLEFACQSHHGYLLHQGLQGVEYARLAILQMIRPIMEAMRNILRNHILHKLGCSYKFIELRPKTTQRPSAICNRCSRSFKLRESLWVTCYSLHEYRNQCECCSCDATHHVPVDYQLDYELVDTVGYPSNDLAILNQELFPASVHFAHFLDQNIDRSSQNPFLACLNRMIHEESYICDHEGYHQSNRALHNELLKLKMDYKQDMKCMVQRSEHDHLVIINDYIESVKKIPIIRDQISAISRIQDN